MSIPKYRVFLRDLEYRLVDEITDYLSLTAIKRFNRVGTWVMELPAEHKLVPLITRRSGIVIKRDNVVIFSGSIGTELKQTALTFQLGGFDDNLILEEPCRPTPTQAAAPYPDDYHLLGGPGFPASTVMREIVNTNIGPLAPTGCRLDKLALGTDPLLGTGVTFRGNFQPILTALAEVAVTPAAGGLGFEILQSDTLVNMIELRTYAPQLRPEAIFSTPLNTARDFEDIWEFPQANYWVVMGGDGFGASSRTIVEAGDVGAIDEVGRRITGVWIAAGVSDPGELNQKLAELLAGSVTSRRTTIEPFEVASLEYGDDWDFGDIVTVVVNGEATQEVIREVQLDFTSDAGVVVTPMIGDAGADNDDRLSRHVKVVKDRLANWELNWRVPDDSVIRNMLHPTVKPPIGEVKWLAGSSVPTGHLLCAGQAVSRETYILLFTAIGTTWGDGNGSTTFNLPNLVDRSPIGSGSSYSVGQYVGVSTINAAIAHTHPGSHSHGLNGHTHAAQAHTHPGSHSHGMVAHRHQMGHDHEVNQGPSSTSTRQDGANAVGSATHTHGTTSNSNNTVTGDGERTVLGGPFTTTEADSNAPSASYSGGPSGPSPSSSESDSNAHAASFGGSGTVSIVHPSAALLPVIYAGV